MVIAYWLQRLRRSCFPTILEQHQDKLSAGLKPVQKIVNTFNRRRESWAQYSDGSRIYLQEALPDWAEHLPTEDIAVPYYC